MTTPYSRRPEAIAAARAFLVSVRDRPDDALPRYGEVAKVYGGVPQGVAPVLNAIARDCTQAGEPDLSALVVLADTGLPGRLNGQLVDPQDPRVRQGQARNSRSPASQGGLGLGVLVGLCVDA